MHGGILLPLECKLDYVKMKHNYMCMLINMQHIDVDINYISQLSKLIYAISI